jgi:hypothetical protein
LIPPEEAVEDAVTMFGRATGALIDDGAQDAVVTRPFHEDRNGRSGRNWMTKSAQSADQ